MIIFNMRHNTFYLPSRGSGFDTLTKRAKGCGISGGTILLDGGFGGQSSYMDGLPEYLHTTNNTPLSKVMKNQNRKKSEGLGLQQISSKLSNLMIKPPDSGPKRKPIAFSI
jgi:hypothetical protein